MINENAKNWIKALRSGKFVQGKNYLRSANGHCCLGVACDLAVEAGVIPAPTTVDHPLLKGVVYKYGTAGDKCGLPDEVQGWLNLRTNMGGRSSGPALYELNDDNGLSFEQIADVIENDKGFFND